MTLTEKQVQHIRSLQIPKKGSAANYIQIFIVLTLTAGYFGLLPAHLASVLLVVFMGMIAVSVFFALCDIILLRNIHVIPDKNFVDALLFENLSKNPVFMTTTDAFSRVFYYCILVVFSIGSGIISMLFLITLLIFIYSIYVPSATKATMERLAEIEQNE